MTAPDLDAMTPLQRTIVERALALAQELEATAGAAPGGHVIDRCESLLLGASREFLRAALEEPLLGLTLLNAGIHWCIQEDVQHSVAQKIAPVHFAKSPRFTISMGWVSLPRIMKIPDRHGFWGSGQRYPPRDAEIRRFCSQLS